VTVTNHSPDVSVGVTGIDWSFGERTGTIAGGGDGATVPPLAGRTFHATVDGASAYAVQPVEATARLADGRTAHDSDSFGFSPIVRATPHLVDGRLTGLENVPKVDLSEVGSYNGIEPSAADGDIWATWDDKNLHVSAIVREKDHRTARKIAWLPAGDSIGIGVHPGKPGEGLGSWGADWYMLHAGDTVTQGPGVFVESLPKGLPDGVRGGRRCPGRPRRGGRDDDLPGRRAVAADGPAVARGPRVLADPDGQQERRCPAKERAKPP
jgi:hypothetical protein